jgi:hypothetical protein
MCPNYGAGQEQEPEPESRELRRVDFGEDLRETSQNHRISVSAALSKPASSITDSIQD